MVFIHVFQSIFPLLHIAECVWYLPVVYVRAFGVSMPVLHQSSFVSIKRASGQARSGAPVLAGGPTQVGVVGAPPGVKAPVKLLGERL